MMEDGVFPPNINMFYSSPDPITDMDMDELLFDGCWLGTNDGSEFLNHSPTSSSPFDPSFIWPTLEDNNGESSGNSSLKDSQEERQISSFSENLSISQQQGQNSAQIQYLGENMINALGSSSQTEEDCLVEGLELSRKWWIGPRPNHGLAISVMERLIRALEYFEGCTSNRDFLLQIWAPVNRGGRLVLSTSGQPFSLDLNCPRLASYRDISVNYQFSAEKDSKEVLGLPGRVFMGKVPEWTPDVRFFRREEYPRVVYAQQYDVRGTLAVPVFEQGSRSCLGVIEVVTTSQKINYKPELESVCKALEVCFLSLLLKVLSSLVNLLVLP